MTARRLAMGLLLAANCLLVLVVCYCMWPSAQAGGAAPPAPPPAKGQLPNKLSAEPDQVIAGAPAMIVAMAADPRGRIWVGTEESGVWIHDPQANTWQQIARKDGLGDDYVYAIAADAAGNMWVGHLNHGVSVFDGTTWRNYAPPDGPIGGRIFALAACPADGDMWMATDAGLTRYSPANGAWAHCTRAAGLPSDQANSIAFDAAGNIFVGTQCDGIAMASAADQYKTWRSVVGPDAMPAMPRGEGLAGRLVNQVLVARDGTVYAATTRGLARSHDGGKTWSHLRGGDWQTLVENSALGAPKDWKPARTTPLREDWILSMAEDDAGMLWLGGRCKGCQRLYPRTDQADDANDTSFGGAGVTAVVCVPGGPTYFANYRGMLTRSGTVYAPAGGGLADSRKGLGSAASTRPQTLDPKPNGAFPPKPAPPTLAEIESARQQLRQLSAARVPAAAVLGDDWATQGDWVGRYGRQLAILCNLNWTLFREGGHMITFSPGPRAERRLPWAHSASETSADSRVPIDPRTAKRTVGYWHDASDRHEVPMELDGPDLWVSVDVNAGPHRLSLYFVNQDAGTNEHVYRDYVVELRRDVPPRQDETVLFVSTDVHSARKLAAIEATPPLARSRATRFRGGVYKQFLVNGAGRWWIRIARNHSFGTRLTALMIDRMPADFGTRWAVNDPGYSPPPAYLAGASGAASGPAEAAEKLWTALDECWGANSAAYQRPYRLLAYRGRASAGDAAALLTNWRWQLGLWTLEDRGEFGAAMVRSALRGTPEIDGGLIRE